MSGVIKDLGVYVRMDLSWTNHLEEKLKKAVRLLYYVRRNTSPMTTAHAKLPLQIFDLAYYYLCFPVHSSNKNIDE